MPGNISLSTSSADAPGGVLGLAAMGVLGANVYGLFSWPWIAALAFGYALLCVVVWTVPVLKPEEDNWLTNLGHALLGLSLVAAFVFSILVGGLLYMKFQTAAWIIVGLFTVGVLCYAAGGAPRLLLNLAFAALLALGIQLLPPPPGSLDDEADLPGRLKLVIR